VEEGWGELCENKGKHVTAGGKALKGKTNDRSKRNKQSDGNYRRWRSFGGR